MSESGDSDLPLGRPAPDTPDAALLALPKCMFTVSQQRGQEIVGSLVVRSLLLMAILRLVRLNGLSVGSRFALPQAACITRCALPQTRPPHWTMFANRLCGYTTLSPWANGNERLGCGLPPTRDGTLHMCGTQLPLWKKCVSLPTWLKAMRRVDMWG